MPSSLFRSQGFQSAGFLNFSPTEAYAEANAGAIIVDVREEYLIGYKLFGVPEVIYMPLSQLNKKYNELPKNKGIILADSVGLKSKEAMLFLTKEGFTNIANLAGGLVEWEQDGMPLKKDKTEQLDGSCMCQLKPRNKTKK